MKHIRRKLTFFFFQKKQKLQATLRFHLTPVRMTRIKNSDDSAKHGGTWYTSLIPVLGRQRQADFWVRGQPGIQSEFQDSQGYTEKPSLKKQKTKTKTKVRRRTEFQAVMSERGCWHGPSAHPDGGWRRVLATKQGQQPSLRWEAMINELHSTVLSSYSIK
jgi:hypothetical protein